MAARCNMTRCKICPSSQPSIQTTEFKGTIDSNVEYRGLAALFGPDQSESHSKLDIYAQGREEAFEDLERDLRVRIKAMKRARRKMELRIAASFTTLEAIDGILPGYERQLKRVVEHKRETARSRKGLV